MLKKLISQQRHPLFYFLPAATQFVCFCLLAWIACVSLRWTDISLCVVVGVMFVAEFRKMAQSFQDWRLYALLVESEKLHQQVHMRLRKLKPMKLD